MTLTSSAFTLPEAFTNAGLGHALSQFGKWHLATALNSPLTVGGWTNYLGCIPGQVTDYYNWTKTTNGVSSTSTSYATTDLVNDATNWISARGTNAWFVWAAFNAPHIPFHRPPQALCPSYPTNTLTTNRRMYEAVVEALDTEIGRLLSVVNRTNTYIIFIGDNGTQGNIIQPPFPSGRGKNSLYEGGTHVPLIISGPAVVNPNRTNATLCGMVDLFATILEVAGSSVSAAVPPGVAIDGQSLMPAVQTTNTSPRYAYSELFGANVSPQSATGQTLRNSQFKLIRFNDRHEEFYDLQNDPYETVNLLTNPLSATAQSNYFGLFLKLAGYQSALAQPLITGWGKTNLQFTATVARATNLTYTLWRAPVFDDLAWSPQTNAIVVTNGVTSVTLTDTNAGGQQNFYRVVGALP